MAVGEIASILNNPCVSICVCIYVRMCVCLCVRYMWCLSCGRPVSVWITVNSEATMILEMPTSLKRSEEGEDSWNLLFVCNFSDLLFGSCYVLLNVRSTLIRSSSSHREIPLELRQRSRGGQVNLDMEDHRDEDFTKPKMAFKAFEGEGQKLGRWGWRLI